MLVGYCRVSTKDQNVDLQKDALKAAGCEVIFDDVGISGVKATRPGLDKALACVRSGDVLVIWKLDRLGRSLRNLIELVSDLKEREVQFRSLTEGFDTTTPAGRVLFHIIGALAEMERDLIRERTSAGLTAARARGRHGGRKKNLTNGALRAAKAMMADRDTSPAEIAKTLNVSRATLYRSLARAGAA